MASEAEIRDLAEARVAFRQHALVYVLVNLFLAALWFITSDGRSLTSYWPIWVHLGWGIGLLSNAWCVYGGGVDAVRREEEKIRAELARRA